MERKLSILLLLIAICLDWCRAQLEEGEDGTATPLWALSDRIQGGSSTVCNKTFADVNATGIFSLNPNVAQGPQSGQPDNNSGSTLDSLVAVTIANPGFTNTSNSSSSYSLWFNTNGANYTNDYALGYDVCVLAGFSLNYNTQLRGQKDDGTCSTALDDACISAIKERTEQYATWLSTPSPGPNSNLTNTSLPGICRTLATEVSQNIPDECSYFFQDQSAAIGWPLTSYGDAYETALFDDCTLNSTWKNTVSFFNNASQSIYESWVESVTPVIGVWMPVVAIGANVGSQITIAETVAEIFCGHVQNFTENSYEPPAAPSPTPVHYNTTTNANNSTTNGTTAAAPESDGLSGGAIAGVTVGVVVGVLAIAAGIFWLLWRRRKARTLAAHTEIAEAGGEEKRFAELPPEAGIKQLPASTAEGGGEKPAELHGGKHVMELEGEKTAARNELEGDKPVVRDPVELPGSEP